MLYVSLIALMNDDINGRPRCSHG